MAPWLADLRVSSPVDSLLADTPGKLEVVGSFCSFDI